MIINRKPIADGKECKMYEWCFKEGNSSLQKSFVLFPRIQLSNFLWYAIAVLEQIATSDIYLDKLGVFDLAF